MRRISRIVFRSTTAVMLVGSFICSIHAQQSDKKAFTFRGKIDQVNTSTKRLTVHSEPIEGWMGEMTMGFAVDNDAVFNRAKAGDQIARRAGGSARELHRGGRSNDSRRPAIGRPGADGLGE
jgi:Cu/Ag efflux protein CusF